MLMVRTYLSLAGSKGIGLFAGEPISAGHIWWKGDPTFDRIMSKEIVDSLPAITREFLGTYATANTDGSWYVCVDNARFVNHSDTPNTAPKDHVGPDGVGDWVASRNIDAGEEITSDYRFCCETCRIGLHFENKE
jgi:hypothetical protein